MQGRTGRPLPAGADALRLFVLDGNAFGAEVARLLGQPLAAHEEREFEEGGEHKARPLDAVAGRDVYVLHSLHGEPGRSANDKLCRLLFFIGACRDAGAARITAVAPYLCYARKDRRTRPQDPLALRYVAAMFEAVGTDAVVALEVHNETAFQNAFRCRTVALAAAPLFLEHVRPLAAGPLAVIAPDSGAMKRAERFRRALEAATGAQVGSGMVEKHRIAGRISGGLFAGEVAGRTVLIVDDMIASGSTMLRAARAARAAGARRTVALAAHGLFAPGAAELLADPALDRIAVADAVPPFRLAAGPVRDRLDLLPVAPLLAEAIRRLHQDLPLDDLMAL